MGTREAIRAVVTRRFHASADRVFDAWLSREMIGQWMFGPPVREEEIIHLSLTPKVGGSFSFLVEREGKEIEHVGKYLEISRPCRLVFTWTVTTEPVGSRVIVEIEPGQTGCELTVTHELHPSCAEQVGRTEEAWSKMFDALAPALAGGGVLSVPPSGRPLHRIDPFRALGRTHKNASGFPDQTCHLIGDKPFPALQ